MTLKKAFFTIALAIFYLSLTAQEDTDFSIDYEKYTLDNGLEVILHQDHSDPIVSVAIHYDVGSGRERPGKTGFAHLFEHMLFQESENVPQDQFFKKIQDAGGTLNGFTTRDRTVYYEVVPKNALEMVLWMESDRMGFFINTVTESAFANQQEVVKNEKRQRVDNRPYGHVSWVLDKNIYPEGHPYNWQVIGELVDVQAATVEDVQEFYDQFYGPNNATLVVAGDFETDEVRDLIATYFGEIERRQEVQPLEPHPVTLSETVRLYHEDNFATAPRLDMVWPTRELYTEDSYALDFLAELLSRGKKAPMYKVLVRDKELTSRAYAYNSESLLAGEFHIVVTANEDVDLDDVEQGLEEAFALFEEEGITDHDIERIKAGLETDFYNGISSIIGKAFQLAQYNVFAGEPSFIAEDIKNIKEVTKEDVLRVYEKYIKDKPYVMTSFVPKEATDLITKNSVRSPVVEEKVTENIEEEITETDEEIKRTPSLIDRSVEPEQGRAPGLKLPEVWTDSLSNGIRVYGIVHDELPLVSFNMVMDGGHLLDNLEHNGVANLISDMMMEGTERKTPEELEEAIDLLGANINIYTSHEAITISGNCLARNFDRTMALVREIILEPRWDEDEFERVKLKTINDIKRSNADPNSIAGRVFNKILYGPDHMYSYPTSGTVEDVEKITIDDLKRFYFLNISPTVSRFHIVGAIDREATLGALEGLKRRWAPRKVVIPDYPAENNRTKSSLYFVDIPDAKQSVIQIGNISLPRTSDDYFPVQVMNYKLGGSFSGNVNLILREEKGYTYGARTGFSGTKIPGTFRASSSVRTNVTGESVEIFRDEIKKYQAGIFEEDLDFTQNAMIKSNARAFETQGALLGMLRTMSKYDLEPDYKKQEEEIVRNMTVEQHRELANKYLDETTMAYLIVGDAATQFEQFKEMGFDEVIMLDKDGERVSE